ncbi:hypothetical protein H4Q26_005895 [Puccinia striiformis f. sp. tritici PST-130]|nr:hypothetical protein H4Q26_005895 [Puccinia striiformis f. sp. tritici PST-130]
MHSGPEDQNEKRRRQAVIFAPVWCHNRYCVRETRNSNVYKLRWIVPYPFAEGNFSTPIKDWITGMCAAKPCTEQALKLAISDLKDGCKAELTNQAPSTGALFSIFSHYKDIRDTSCKNTDKLDFCEPSLLDTVENLKHTKRAFFTVSASAYCSECRKKNADKPNPPTKRSESDPKEKPDVCSGTAAALEKKSSSKGPKESSKSEDKPGKGEKSTSQNPPKSEKSDDKLKSAEGPEIKPENGVKIDTSTNQDSSSKPKPGNGENTGAALQLTLEKLASQPTFLWL